jgi:hypothetical protein
VPRWRQGEEQKLALTGFDALDEIHAREGTARSRLLESDALGCLDRPCLVERAACQRFLAKAIAMRWPRR